MLYKELAEKGLLSKILKNAMEKTGDLHKPGTFLKAHSEPKRPLTRLEAYLSHCGYCSANFLSYLEKIEHIGFFISDGTISTKNKKNGINGHQILLYHIENFIIRTQGLIERTLILIDAILHLGNDSQFMTYDLIKSNMHVKRIGLDSELRKLKKVTRDFQYRRNQIIHARGYLDDSLRKLECLYLVYGIWEKEGLKKEELKYMKLDIKHDECQIRLDWNKRVNDFIDKIKPIIEAMLEKMEPMYKTYKKSFE